uniref:Uncharacterized protein n=1 Tax=Lactuca sativa TaxID=4236 RepID=A0A9R1VLE7_LACSA|nr:hypothetical protein LSAT_V11C500269900 [Lactuca sativa]
MSQLRDIDSSIYDGVSSVDCSMNESKFLGRRQMLILGVSVDRGWVTDPVADVQLLESPFSGEEIKDSVWDYGGDRAPSPDGVSYKFLKHYCV